MMIYDDICSLFKCTNEGISPRLVDLSVLMGVLFQDWLNHVEPLFVEKRWHIACYVIFLGCCKMVTSGESRGI